MGNSKITNTGTTDPKERPAEVAYCLNAGIARDYQDALFAEEQRLVRDVLAPRALGERTVLIIGGAGYIGSVLTEHLLARGYRVRCLDALIYNNQTTVLPFLAHPRYDFLNRDLTDAEALAATLCQSAQDRRQQHRRLAC